MNEPKMTFADREKARRTTPVFVKPADVKRQRYLRDHSLPHSERVASVLLASSRTRRAINPFA